MASIDARLNEWLRDAHDMETHVERMLTRQVRYLNDYPEFQTRIERHIVETKGQARALRGCIEHRGAWGPAVMNGKGGHAAHGLMRGMASKEFLQAAITTQAFKHYEIGCYQAMICAAEQVGDHDTQSTCEEILAQEKAMAEWVSEHFPPTAKAWLRNELNPAGDALAGDVAAHPAG